MNEIYLIISVLIVSTIIYEYYKSTKRHSQIRIVGKGLNLKANIVGDEAELKRLLAYGCYENKNLETALYKVIDNCTQYNRTGEDYVYEYNFDEKVKIDLYSLDSNPEQVKIVVKGGVDELTTLLGAGASQDSDENHRSVLADACINLVIFVNEEMDKDFYARCVFEPSENPIICKNCDRHKTQHWQ
jgi:hypothetical protein